MTLSETWHFVDFESLKDILDIFVGVDEKLVINPLILIWTLWIISKKHFSCLDLSFINKSTSIFLLLEHFSFFIILILKIFPLLMEHVGLILTDVFSDITSWCIGGISKIFWEIGITITLSNFVNGLSLLYTVVLILSPTLFIILSGLLHLDMLSLLSVEDSFSHVFALLKFG